MGYDRIAVQIYQALVEQAIGTIRREFLDHVLFWNENDLSKKLNQYLAYYNKSCGHLSLQGMTPEQKVRSTVRSMLPITDYNWISHCNGLFSTPIACQTRISQADIAGGLAGGGGGRWHAADTARQP